jgi:hypothetical protein
MVENPRWRTRNFDFALLKYGYQFKGLVTNDSKTKNLDILCDVALNPTWRYIQDGGLDIFNVLL